jgi:uncharacterized protein (TIGR00251 family)
MRISVRLTPRASSDSIEGFDATGILKVRVTAAPADGAANEALTKLLAKALGVPVRDVSLVSGATNRNKVFEIPLAEPELRDRIEAATARR